MLKWMVIGLGVLPAAAVLVLLAITWIESRQARQVSGIEPHTPPAAAPSGAAVVYFSRSGNTALAARHVARRLGAGLHAIEAPQYALGPAGLARSAMDANSSKSRPVFTSSGLVMSTSMPRSNCSAILMRRLLLFMK